MSLLLKLSLVIYAVLVTIYCFQKKFRSQRWLRIFSKMLCSVGFLLVAGGLRSGIRIPERTTLELGDLCRSGVLRSGRSFSCSAKRRSRQKEI